MIVRILGEAQYDVPEDQRAGLDDLDKTLVKAVDANDEASFTTALMALAAEVRRVGTPLPDDAFIPSELVVPFADASLEETKRLLADAASADEG
jgi:hypothetical protein